MTLAILLVCSVLATWRVTHLIVDDVFPPIEKVRNKIVDRNPEGALAYLVNCTFCASVWTGFAVAGALAFILPPMGVSVPAFLIPFMGFSLSTTTVVLETLLSGR